jgi:chemotaxis protein MotC
MKLWVIGFALMAVAALALPLAFKSADPPATEPTTQDVQTHDADAKDAQDHGTQLADAQAKDAQPADPQSKDVQDGVSQPADDQAKDTQDKSTQLADNQNKDAQERGTQPADSQNKDAQEQGTQPADSQNKDAHDKGIQPIDIQNKDIPDKGTPPVETQNKDIQASDTQRTDVQGADAHEKDTHAKDAAVHDVQAKDAQNDAQQPYHLVRTLEQVQDRIAEGNSQAHGFQRRFIAEIADKMLGATDETWREPKNTLSAIVYVLSGGDPRVLRKLLTISSLREISPQLIKGVLAYSEGRNRDALKLLDDIDHRRFETRIAGHLALAKAMSAASENAPKALGYLDDARLLCPGTLVEEAALRREVLLLSNVDDYERFEMLAFAYLRRFPKSIYAKNFYRSFAIAVVTGKYGTDPKLMERLERRLEELSEGVRKQIYMAIAEEGVIRGRVELTRLASDRIGHLFRDGGRDAVRLQLYKAAALVVTQEYDFAYTRLRSIDRTKLSTGDLELLDSALALATEMRQPPQIQGEIKELPPLSSAAQVKHGAIAEKSEALDGARQALSQADAVLNKDRR